MTKRRRKGKKRFAWLQVVEGGREQTIWSPTTYYSGHPLETILDTPHVLCAIKAKGWGNSQQCAGAFCIHDPDHIHLFPPGTHYVDWTDSRLMVAPCDANGLPGKTTIYEHNHPEISKLFDQRKKGHLALLKCIRERGPIKITLSAPDLTPRPGWPTGNRTGILIRKREERQRGARGRAIRVQKGLTTAATPRETDERVMGAPKGAQQIEAS